MRKKHKLIEFNQATPFGNVLLNILEERAEDIESQQEEKDLPDIGEINGRLDISHGPREDGLR